MRNQQEASLMRKIDEASFSMDDVALYLDTHPNDVNALNYYHHVTALRKEALNAYEAQFGPLLIDSVQSRDRWTWETDRWPWEREV